MMRAQEAIDRLKAGNLEYLTSTDSTGDISLAKRQDTAINGQHPFAIVVACSDSRVIPEDIFMCGIGDLFTIRVAGNVIDDHQLGSIEYAAEHLHCPLTLVLGHTNCGAVNAAVTGHTEGFIRFITDEISLAIGDEKDDRKASCLNARHSAELIKQAFEEHPELGSMRVISAVYDIATGEIEWED